MRRSLFVFISMSSALFAGSVPGLARAEERSPGTSASSPAPTPMAAPSTASTGPSGPAPADPTVTVDLHANDGRATLERRRATHTFSGLGMPDLGIGGVTEWEAVCVSPCATPVSRNATYRVAGDGLVPSSTFAIAGGTPRLRLDADLGSSKSRISGALLTLAGAGALVLGTGALVTSPILAANDLGSEGFRTGLLGGGIATVSVGALLVAVGVTLWVTNDSTLRFEPSPTGQTTAQRATPKGRWLPNGFSF